MPDYTYPYTPPEPEEVTAQVAPGTPLKEQAAAAMLRQLAGMRGFPPTPESLATVARAFVRIAGTSERGQWLITQIADGFDYFPAPIQMRRLFTKKYPPADGRRNWDVDCAEY